MDIKLHKQSTTTPKIRAEIQAALPSITDSELVCHHGVATATIRRWRYCDEIYDRSHTRHTCWPGSPPNKKKYWSRLENFFASAWTVFSWWRVSS